MKKMLFPMIVLSVLSLSVCAQEVFTIIYSLENDSLQIKNKNILDLIKEGQLYQIKVTGVNQVLYKIQVNNTDTTISKPIDMPTYGNFEIDAVSKLISSLSPLSVSILKTTNTMEGLTKSNVPLSGVKFDINKFREEQKEYLNELQRIKNEIDQAQFNIYLYEVRSFQNKPPSENDTTVDLPGTMKKFVKLRDIIARLEVKIDNHQTEFKDATVLYKDEIEKEELKEDVDGTLKIYEELLKAVKEAQLVLSADKVRELLLRIVHLENNANRTYTSLPIQFKGEQAAISVSIIPRKDEYMLQTKNSGPYVFPMRNRSYTAVGMAFYGSSLYDEVYSTIASPVTDSTYNYTFVKEKGAKFEFGMTALLRFGKKWDNKKDNIGYHFSFGPGISISNKIRARFLLGPGLSFGRKHMFTVDGGLIFGQVDRKSIAVDLSEPAMEQPDNLTISKSQVGGYLAIGYLFKF